MNLVESIYRISQGFPTSEMYGLTSQMRRAVVSVPANIAEGYARESTREYLQFLSVAQGSLAELETHVEIAARLHYLQAEVAVDLTAAIASLRKQLFRLRDAIGRKLPPTPDSRLPTPPSALC